MSLIVYGRSIANIIIISSLTAIIVLLEIGILPTHKAGFYCKDPALSYNPGDETVTNTLIIVVSIMAPVLTILLNEMLLHICDTDSYNYTKLLKDLNLAYVWLRGYFQAAGVGLFVIELTKFIIGKPRPTFISVCAPDKAFNCSEGEYIQEFQCTNTFHSDYDILDNSRSFPSGHAGLSVFTGVFLFWYLQRRGGGPWLWVVLLQMLALLWAMVASLSRINDHRHHWWDVLGGTVIGAISAVYGVMELCSCFSSTRSPAEFFRYLHKNRQIKSPKTEDFTIV